MFLVLFAIILSVTDAAIPMSKKEEPVIIAVDGVEGVLYEIPDYDSSDWNDFDLAAKGAVPVLTILEMDKTLRTKDGPLTYKDMIAENIRVLGKALKELSLTKSKLESGDTDVRPEIQKIIKDLEDVERSFQPDVQTLMTSVNKHDSSLQAAMIAANSDEEPESRESNEDWMTTKSKNKANDDKSIYKKHLTMKQAKSY